jgi:beta-alanine degradation protein BauB
LTVRLDLEKTLDAIEGGKMTRKLQFVCAIGIGLLVRTASAQDVMTVAADHYKVLVDNAQVRVVQNTLRPGEKDPFHTHAAGWYYVTSPGQMKVTHSDGKSEIWDAKAGEAAWMEPEGAHTSENVGKTVLSYVLVEVKSAASRGGK